MAKLNNAQLQEKLDIAKWNDSQEKGVDTCGQYDYCNFCDKTVDTPCAKAYNKAAAANKPAAEKKPAAKKAATTKKK